MTSHVVWDNEEKTIILQRYSGHVRREDYFTATDEFERLAKSAPYAVHSIMDRTAVLTTPGVVLPALRYANNHVPPNLAIRVIVNADLFTRTIVDIGRRVAPRLVQNVYFAATLEEARAIIAEKTRSTNNSTTPAIK